MKSTSEPFTLPSHRLSRYITYLQALLLAAVMTCPAEPALANWNALAALERDGARVSAAAVDLDRGTVIQQLDANLRLTPASLTKLITAAAALQAWPPDKVFHTRLLSAAAIHDGVLDGDLILQGAGDASLDEQSLWALAAQLEGYGIRSVAGRLVVSLTPFGRMDCGTQDRCKALVRSDDAYNAPIASFGVDFGNWCVIVTPTQAGRAALVRGCGVGRLPLAVNGSVRTVAAGARQTLWVERDTDSAGDSLRIGGDLPIGSEQTVYRAMSDPARGAGLLFAEILHEIGIRCGPVIVSAQPAPAAAYPLAETQGLTLREQLGRMLRFSNNYIADVLVLDLAADLSGSPPPDLASAAAVLTQFMSRVQRATPRYDSASPPLFSGSGLTVENRLSASDLTALLAYQYHDTRHFPAFYGALTVPRDAPFAFLRGDGNAAWLDRAAIKTGTLNDPVSVCGLAGYLRRRDGDWIAFAVIVNGGPGRHHIPLDTAMRAIQSDLQALLSRGSTDAAASPRHTRTER